MCVMREFSTIEQAICGESSLSSARLPVLNWLNFQSLYSRWAFFSRFGEELSKVAEKCFGLADYITFEDKYRFQEEAGLLRYLFRLPSICI